MERYDGEDFPHGLRCAACGEEFSEGQPIAERLEAFIDDKPLVVLTCVACDLSGRPLIEEEEGDE